MEKTTKKPFSAPTITEHGSVVKMTRGAWGLHVEALGKRTVWDDDPDDGRID